MLILALIFLATIFHLVQLAEHAFLLQKMNEELRPGEENHGYAKCVNCFGVRCIIGEKHPYYVTNEEGDKLFVDEKCYKGDLRQGFKKVPIKKKN
jgi:hypothetical protein